MNTLEPQPTMKVKNLGPKSRAGLIAPPQLYEKHIPIIIMTSPLKIALNPCGMTMFCLSLIVRTVITKRPEPIT